MSEGPDQVSLVTFGANGQSNLNDHSLKDYRAVTGRETVPEEAYDRGLALAREHSWYDNWLIAMKDAGTDKDIAEAVFEALLWDGKIVEPILGKIEVVE